MELKCSIVIIKILKYGQKDRTGEVEKKVFSALNNNNIFPKLYDFIKFESDKKYLIQSLHGPNLRRLQDLCDSQKFSEHTKYRIGVGLISCKRISSCNRIFAYGFKTRLHSLGNGTNESWYNLDFILIDFGFAVRYRDEKGIHFKKNKYFKQSILILYII